MVGVRQSVFQSSFLKLYGCPAVLFPMVDKAQPVPFGFGADDGNVFYVKSAHQQAGAGVHPGYVVLHVVQQDVAVDVGNHYVERAFVGQAGSVSLADVDAVNVVQSDVLERVAHAPFVDVDGCAGGGSTHACQNGKNGSATAHVEQRFSLKVGLQQFADDEAGGFVMSRSECHLRIDDDVVFRLRHVVVESAVDDTAVADDDGLEKVLLPFFVPVLVFGFRIGIGNGGVG